MIDIWLDIKKDIDRVDPKNVYVIMDNRVAYVTDYLKDRDVCIVNPYRRYACTNYIDSNDYIIYYVGNVLVYGKANDRNALDVLERRRIELGVDSDGKEWKICLNK